MRSCRRRGRCWPPPSRCGPAPSPGSRSPPSRSASGWWCATCASIRWPGRWPSSARCCMRALLPTASSTAKPGCSSSSSPWPAGAGGSGSAARGADGQALRVHRLSPRQRWLVLAATRGGLAVARPAARPPHRQRRALVDALPTVGSMAGQSLLGRKLVENWPVWVAVNLFSIGLFALKGLWLTVLLYARVHRAGAVGWRAWHRLARNPDWRMSGALVDRHRRRREHRQDRAGAGAGCAAWPARPACAAPGCGELLRDWCDAARPHAAARRADRHRRRADATHRGRRGRTRRRARRHHAADDGRLQPAALRRRRTAPGRRPPGTQPLRADAAVRARPAVGGRWPAARRPAGARAGGRRSAAAAAAHTAALGAGVGCR